MCAGTTPRAGCPQAGNATIGLEIIEDLPDVDAVLVPFGGGALACGIGSIIKAKRGDACSVYACEPATAAPATLSFQTGKRCEKLATWRQSFVDGCGGKAVLKPIWPVAQQVRGGRPPARRAAPKPACRPQPQA